MTAVAYLVTESKNTVDFNANAITQIAAGQYPIGLPFLNPKSASGKRICQTWASVSNGVTNYELVAAATPTALAALVATEVTASYVPQGAAFLHPDAAGGKLFHQALAKGGSVFDAAAASSSFHKTVPVTGDTIALAPKVEYATENVAPIGTLAALTLTIANGVIDGQVQDVFFKAITTALTSSGSNLKTTGLALPTATTAGQLIRFVWSVTETGWIRTL